MGIPQPTESRVITLGRTKTPRAAPTPQRHAPTSSRFHFSTFWRREKAASRRWVGSGKTRWCVCVGVGGVGAGPNVFIAPMKRPEKPNKSATQTRTKAGEVIGAFCRALCARLHFNPQHLQRGSRRSASPLKQTAPVWKGHLRVSEGLKEILF